MKVEFIWDDDCPNIKEARANLMKAFSRTDTPARWDEWRRDDPQAPDYVLGYGSPTILVDGVDVAGVPEGTDGNCCRVYPETDGSVSGVPSVEMIARRLADDSQVLAAEPAGDTSKQDRDNGKLQWLGVAPGLALGLLPKVSCPLCWPAYAGVLSAAGLGFLLDSAWLLPLSIVFMALAVGSLAWRAKQRRGYAPFWLGLPAAAGLLVGKFVFDSEAAVYLGAGTIFVAAVWNSWPRRNPQPECAACVEN
jgi:hypothetical protein